MKRFALFLTLAASVPSLACAQDTTLAGLWQSKRWFGPDARGELRITRVADRWQAAIASRSANVRVSHDSMSFELPAAANFKGRILSNGSMIGQWIEPDRRIAMPLVFASCGSGCYSTVVNPQES